MLENGKMRHGDQPPPLNLLGRVILPLPRPNLLRNRSRKPLRHRRSRICSTSMTMPGVLPLQSLPPHQQLLSPQRATLQFRMTVSLAGRLLIDLMLTVFIVDDFDDFQSAPSATTTAPVPAPSPMAATAPASKPAANVFDLLNATPAAPASATAAGRPSMGYGMGGGTMPSRTPTFAPMKPATPASPVPAASAKATNGGGFDDLWTMSLGGSKPSTPAAGSNTGKTIQDLQREKASQVFWGAGTSTHRPGSASIGGGQSAASSGADDLLL
jgi:hypothetical protein